MELDSKEDAKVIYGLYCVFSNITKMTVILLIAFFSGYIYETLVFTGVFASLRSFSFGMHAQKSWQCTIISILIFNGIPIIAVNMNINLYLALVMLVFSGVAFFLYAPADTAARPIKKEEERKRFKIKTMIVFTLSVFILFIIKDMITEQIVIMAIFTQAVNILPISYSLFKQPYRNYEKV